MKNPTLAALLLTLTETIDDILKQEDVTSLDLVEIPMLNDEASATLTKEDLVKFYRLDTVFSKLWDRSKTGGFAKIAKNGKVMGWRRPTRHVAVNPNGATGEGRKPWDVERKARMALMHSMNPNERNLDETVARLYGKGKTFDWFVEHYDELKGKKPAPLPQLPVEPGKGNGKKSKN